MPSSHAVCFCYGFLRASHCLSVASLGLSVDQAVSSLWCPPASTSQALGLQIEATPGFLGCFNMKDGWYNPKGSSLGDLKGPFWPSARFLCLLACLFVFFSVDTGARGYKRILVSYKSECNSVSFRFINKNEAILQGHSSRSKGGQLVRLLISVDRDPHGQRQPPTFLASGQWLGGNAPSMSLLSLHLSARLSPWS